jgi:hypothetical protein
VTQLQTTIVLLLRESGRILSVLACHVNVRRVIPSSFPRGEGTVSSDFRFIRTGMRRRRPAELRLLTPDPKVPSVNSV